MGLWKQTKVGISSRRQDEQTLTGVKNVRVPRGSGGTKGGVWQEMSGMINLELTAEDPEGCPSEGGPWQGHRRQCRGGLLSAQHTPYRWSSGTPARPSQVWGGLPAPFSGAQTVGTQAPSDYSAMCVVSCAGAGLKATGHLHGMETTFQFPLTNGRFHFHSPPFPITTTLASPLSIVRHPGFPLWCLCLAHLLGLQKSQHPAIEIPCLGLPPNPAAVPHSLLVHGQSHTGRQGPGCLSWSCP